MLEDYGKELSIYLKNWKFFIIKEMGLEMSQGKTEK